MSNTKPSIPGLAIQDLGSQPSLHAWTERLPTASHAIHAGGFQYSLPPAHLNSN